MIKTPEPESYIRPYNSFDHGDVIDILMQNESHNRFDHDRSSFEETQKDWGEESVLVHVRSFESWRAVTGIVRLTFVGPGQRKALIGDLSVLPGEQGNGVGSKLLEAMKNVCYKRHCLPELLTNANADVSAEEIGTGLVDWYRARGFDDLYPAVGLIGDELPRAWAYSLPNAAYRVAAAAIDKLHDTITSWGYELTCSVDDREIQGGYPDFFKNYVKVHHPGSEVSFDRHNLLVGHPGASFDPASPGSKDIEVWSVVRSDFEDVKILRRLKLPGDFYMQKEPPQVDGEYVFLFPSSNEDEDVNPWIEVVQMNEGRMHKLQHTSNKLQQLIQQKETMRGWRSVGSPGAILGTLYNLIGAQNTLDDMHRYDRRWCGEEGYPMFPHLGSRNRWFPDIRRVLGR
ncbi:MAG TPA: GNAT family N-acetyltransferase [Candidatus Saccharimonadales bacterium]